MKSNVDLTLNRDFSENFSKTKGTSFRGMFRFLPENFQWVERGVKRESFNHENLSSRKDFDDFVAGKTIVNTGSRDVRAHKLDVRSLERKEICYECGEQIRIPWNGCPCYRKYLESHGGNKESCRKQLNYPTIIK